MQSANSIAGGTANAASLGVSLLNIDAGGSLQRLSQMQKIYCRYRFIDINYGVYLEEYFINSASKFDPPTKKSPREINAISKNYNRNMRKYKVAFDPLEVSIMNVVIYCLSWVVKISSTISLGAFFKNG